MTVTIKVLYVTLSMCILRFIHYYAERHCAQCRYAECRYAECRGAK